MYVCMYVVHDYILQWKVSHEFTDSHATRTPTNTHVRHDTHIFVEKIYYLQVGRAARLKTLLLGNRPVLYKASWYPVDGSTQYNNRRERSQYWPPGGQKCNLILQNSPTIEVITSTSIQLMTNILHNTLCKVHHSNSL